MDFRILYSREVHGDESASMEEKAQRACDLSKKIEIPVLLDDIEGSVFDSYGGPPPNATFLIGEGGVILKRVFNIFMSFRVEWAIKKYVI